FKNGRAVRHDFDSSEDCKAFVAALNGGEARPVVTEEAEARAERAAAELLAELGLDDSPYDFAAGDGQVKKSKKKKGGKKKNKKKSKCIRGGNNVRRVRQMDCMIHKVDPFRNSELYVLWRKEVDV
ncbi:hypothetical protein THAOC_27616, partial [Thalassiosira oceanica]